MNVVVSALAAFLTIAPFTPAILLFLFTLPLAAWMAGRGCAVAAWAVVVCALLAFIGTPFHAGNPVSVGSAIGLGWLALWTYAIRSRLRRWRAAGP